MNVIFSELCLYMSPYSHIKQVSFLKLYPAPKYCVEVIGFKNPYLSNTFCLFFRAVYPGTWPGLWATWVQIQAQGCRTTHLTTRLLIQGEVTTPTFWVTQVPHMNNPPCGLWACIRAWGLQGRVKGHQTLSDCPTRVLQTQCQCIMHLR